MADARWRERSWRARAVGSALALAAGLVLTPSSQVRAAEAAEGGMDLGEVIVTARLRAENAQAVPGALSVVGEKLLSVTQTYNFTQLSQLVPSVNYNSPNPRNTALTIRGLGSSVLAIAQANDGLEPGVGFYVDQIYHARPATAAYDFLDVERVEVLRGPQGTLFGKNTTAGAVSITTEAPSFTPEALAEVSYGDYDFWQGKATVSGPVIGDEVAARLSVVGLKRNGFITNVKFGGRDNNAGTGSVHGQILIRPSSTFSLRLSGDFNVFDSKCCTQVFVRVGQSLRSASQQYPSLAAGVGYAPPSLNPYDRLTDIDAAVKVDTNEGGVSAIADWDLGPATLTSVSAWRQWNWDAANDRDYTGLPIQLLQHIPSRQNQYSQELRIASGGEHVIDYVAGLYFFNQVITGRPITQYGPLATYWLLGPAPAFPANLLDGYTTDGRTRFESSSYAAFGEANWHVTRKLKLTAGLRYTDEEKYGKYSAIVFGGLSAVSAALQKAKLSILRPQAYSARVSDGSLAGRAVIAYDLTRSVMAYASYANTSKSSGINMSGLPLTPANQPALATAVIKPEKNQTAEIGVKSQWLDNRLQINADYFYTTIHDFQTNVVDTGPGALRGYLANIDQVRVQGVELDSQFILDSHLSVHASAAFTDGRYISYKDGPCPLERIGNSTTVCDLSGRPLSNLPKTVWTLGGEYKHGLALGALDGEAYLHAEATFRSDIYGDPTDSRYTVIKGYSLVNATLGYRSNSWWEASVWAHNLFDENYLQNVTIQAGNSGLIVGTPGDPRTFGVTLRARY
jgi:iron complex outermembrane recepter protein